MMKDYAGSDDPSKMEQGRDGSMLNVYPSKKVSIPVDINFVKQNGTVNADDSVVSQVQFEIPKNALFKNDAAVLNIIASNKWKRPIYFTSPDAGGIGINNYIRQDGLTYRFVPVLNSEVNNSWVFDKMMSDKFKSGNANVAGVYYDEENRRHLNSIRLAYAQAAGSLADHGKKDEAKKMLEKCDKMMLEENFPYGMVSRGQQHNKFSIQMLIACYKAGDTALADKITKSVSKDLDQQLKYINGLDENKQAGLLYDAEEVKRLQMFMVQIEMQLKNPAPVPPVGDKPAVINAQGVTPAKADSPKK
jgi:hypothetical protein